MSSNARYDAFLSYNSYDRPAVEELAGRLRAEGLALYLEVWELLPGREFQPALTEGLRDSKTCIACLGPNGLGPWQKEQRPKTRLRLPIFTLATDRARESYVVIVVMRSLRF